MIGLRSGMHWNQEGAAAAVARLWRQGALQAPRAPSWRAALCICLLIGLWLPHSRARAAALVLEAELPTEIRGCVALEQLQLAYQRALAAHGGNPAAASPLHVSVRSTPGPVPDTLRLEVTASTESREPGRRELETHAPGMRELGMRELQVHASDCSALADAMGLVLALLARDSPASDSTSPELAPTPKPTPKAVPEPKPEPEPEPKLNPPHIEHVALSAGIGAIFGVLPSAALALQLQAATPSERLSLRVKAAMLLPREKHLAEGVIEARSYELGLEVCSGVKLPGWPRLALRACAGPRLGLIYARGRDFLVHNQRQREFLLYVGLSPEAALRLGGATWLQLGAGSAVALIRPHFEVERMAGKGLLALETPAVLRAEVSLSLVQIF